jgi:hypothetical protein
MAERRAWLRHGARGAEVDDHAAPCYTVILSACECLYPQLALGRVAGST